MLTTKPVGSWCKPEWLFSGPPTHANDDKLDKGKGHDTTWKVGWQGTPEELATRKEQGTVWAIKEQLATGLDIFTDGEQKRESYVHYHLRHLNGIDFDVITEKRYRGGKMIGGLPTFTGAVSTRVLYAAQDFEFAKGVCMAQGKNPDAISISIPGPMTIWDTTANTFYDGEEALCMALAEGVRSEVASLIAAGCKNIMIDEPVWVRYPELVKAWGGRVLDACFKGLPGRENVQIMTHVCCSYPTKSVKSNGRAETKVYETIGPVVAASDLDGISIEHAIQPLDLKVLKLYHPKKVMLGFVAIDPDVPVEEVAAIESKIEEALEHIPADRLICSNDCGCVLLTPQQARAKMTNLCVAAKNVRAKRNIVCPAADLALIDFSSPNGGSTNGKRKR